MNRASALACALAFVAGCGDTSPPVGFDAAARDGGSLDASLDGGGLDTGGGDTGIADDTGAVDGGPSDTGPVTIDANGSDAGPCMASGACDPFDPASCGAMACRPGPTGTSCGPVTTPSAGLGEPCLHATDCEPGLVCLTFSTAEGALCHRMCPTRSVGACDPGYACNGTFGDACVNVCRPLPAACDIYVQDCVSPTDTCTLVRNPETSMPYTGCRPAGTQTEGMACGGASGACDHGLICVATAGVASCRRACDPAAMPSVCTGTTTCTGLAITWGVHYCQAP